MKNRGLTIPDDRVIDTLELSAIAHPLWPDLRLRCPHRAHEDVYRNVRLFVSLIFRLQAKSAEVRSRIRQELPIFQTLWELSSFLPESSGLRGLKGADQDLVPLYELRPEEFIMPGYDVAAVNLFQGKNVVLKGRLPYCFTRSGERKEEREKEDGKEGIGKEGVRKEGLALLGIFEHLLDKEKTISMVVSEPQGGTKGGTKGLGAAFIHSFFDECRKRGIPFSRYLLHPIPYRKWCQGKLQFSQKELLSFTKDKSRKEPGEEAACTVYFMEELPFLGLTEQEFKSLKWPDHSSFYLSRMEWSSDSDEGAFLVKDPGLLDEAKMHKRKRINFLLHRSSRNWLYLRGSEVKAKGFPSGVSGSFGAPGISGLAEETRESGGTAGAPGTPGLAEGTRESGSTAGNFLWENALFLLHVLTGEVRLYPHLESFPWLVADSTESTGEPAAAPQKEGMQEKRGMREERPQEEGMRKEAISQVSSPRLIKVMPQVRTSLVSPDSPYHHLFYTTVLLCILHKVRGEGERVVFLYDPHKYASRDPWPEMIQFLRERSIRVNLARVNLASGTRISRDETRITGGRVSRTGIFRNLELLFEGKQEACFFPATALPEVLEAFSFWQRAYSPPAPGSAVGSIPGSASPGAAGKDHTSLPPLPVKVSLPLPVRRPILLLESLPFRIPLAYSLFSRHGERQGDGYGPAAQVRSRPELPEHGLLEQDRDIHALELVFRKFHAFYLRLFEGVGQVLFFDYRIPDIETRYWPLPPDAECDADLREKVNQLFNPKFWEEKDSPEKESDIDLLLRSVFFREGEFSSEHYERTQKKNVEQFFDSKDQRHRLITLPTGGGKSLIFQLPAIIKTAYSGKLVVIISPLKALIQEQSFKLCSLGMFDFVAGFHQDLDREEVQLYYHQIQDGTLRIIYVTPERFRSPAFRKVLQRRAALDEGLEFVVFDEVHCVADWGYHFRPDYLCCYQDLLLHEIYGRVQGFLFSATVTETNMRLLADKVRHTGSTESKENGTGGPGIKGPGVKGPVIEGTGTEGTETGGPGIKETGIKDVNPENRVPLRPGIEKHIFLIGRTQGRSEKDERQKTGGAITPQSSQADVPQDAQASMPQDDQAGTALGIQAISGDHPGMPLGIQAISGDQAGMPLDIQAAKIEAIRKIIGENLDAERFRAIIFYQSQHGTEELAEMLNEALIKDMRGGEPLHFDCFHAGIPVEEREMIYRRFASGEIQVLVATRAFGMGMDIPNISLVIHYQRPQTLEDYLQEIGRAARRRERFHPPARAYVLLEPQEPVEGGEEVGEGGGGGLIELEQETDCGADVTREAVLNIRSELMEQVFKGGSLQDATFSMQFHGLDFRFDDRLSGISKFSPAPQKRRKEAVVRSALYWLSQYEAGIFAWGEYRLFGLEIDLTADPSAFPLDRAWQRELCRECRAVFSLQELVGQYDGDEKACYLDLLQFQRKGLITISHRGIQPTSFVLPARSEKGSAYDPDPSKALSWGQHGDRTCFFPLFFPLHIGRILFEKVQQKYLAREQSISWPDLVDRITALIREYRPDGKVFFSEEEKNRIWGQESAELEELRREGFFRTPHDSYRGIDHGMDHGVDRGVDHRIDYGVDRGINHGVDYGVDHGVTHGADHEHDGVAQGVDHEHNMDGAMAGYVIDTPFYELDLGHLSGSYPRLEEWLEKHRRKMLHDLVKKSRRIGHLFRFWQRHKIIMYRTENPVERKSLAFRILEVNPKHDFGQDICLAEEIYEYLHQCSPADIERRQPYGCLSTDSPGSRRRAGSGLRPESFGILSIYEQFHKDHSLEEMKRALSLLKVFGYIHYFEQEEEIGYRLTVRPLDQWNKACLDRIREIDQLVRVKEFLTRIFFSVLTQGDRELADQLIADYFTCLHSARSPGFSEHTLALLQKPEHDRLRLRIKSYFSESKEKDYREAKDRELDDEQKKIVEAFGNGASLMVRAGPGAGKTRTLIYAALDLLIRKAVPAENILLLSYTKKAVVELQKRIRAHQPQFDLLNDWRRLNIFTFHGFARKVLGQDEMVRIREEVQDQKGRGGKREENQTELFHQKCMERAAELFSSRHYHYLLIDEFQDVLAERLEFVKKIILKSHKENLTVFLVGDPLQDIFHYQYPKEKQTSFDLLSAFLKEQSIGLTERELTKNYRSCSELCRFFDEYVKENYAFTHRVHRPGREEDKHKGEQGTLEGQGVQEAQGVHAVPRAQEWQESGFPGGITRKVDPAASEQEIHRAIYEPIAEDIACITTCRQAASQNLSIAILGRSNQEVEAAFYHLRRKLSPFGRCLPLNENFPLWRRWDIFEAIRDLARKERQAQRIVDKTAIKAAFDRCRSLGMIPGYIGSYRDWEPMAMLTYLDDRGKGFADIRTWPEEENEILPDPLFLKRGEREQPLEMGRDGSYSGGYAAGYPARAGDSGHIGDSGRIDGIELEDYLIEEALGKRKHGVNSSSLSFAGENTGREGKEREEEEEEKKDGGKGVEIIFSTVHKVKGLEFDVVYLLPFGGSANPSSWEHSPKGREEKNIGYVGITRARHRVIRSLWSGAGAEGSGHTGKRTGQSPQSQSQQMMPVVLSFSGRELISREFGLRFDAWQESTGLYAGVQVEISREGDILLCRFKPQTVIGKVNPNCLKGLGTGPFMYRIRELYVRFYREEDPVYWMGYTGFLKEKLAKGAYFLLPVLEKV
ncbi:MAG: UvrD-helicase domain-containing protein [bacterium]